MDPDPDPGGPKTRGSGFESATLVPVVVVEVDGAGLSLVLQVEQVDELQLLLLLDKKVHAVFDLTGHYCGWWSCLKSLLKSVLINMIQHHAISVPTENNFSPGVIKPLSYF